MHVRAKMVCEHLGNNFEYRIKKGNHVELIHQRSSFLGDESNEGIINTSETCNFIMKLNRISR